MFIGHFAPALIAATHKDAPRLSVLFVAAQLVDWVFFGLLLTGTEKMRIIPGFTAVSPLDLYYMPYTHSLLGSAIFAAGFGVVVGFATKNRTGAYLAATVVLSHWFIDLLVHAPDLTLMGSPPKLGLGLWNNPLIEIPLELALTFGALWLYARARKPRMLPLAGLGGIMLALQSFNWFGPIEPEVAAGTSLLALTAYGIITLAAYWLERSGLAGKRMGG